MSNSSSLDLKNYSLKTAYSPENGSDPNNAVAAIQGIVIHHKLVFSNHCPMAAFQAQVSVIIYKNVICNLGSVSLNCHNFYYFNTKSKLNEWGKAG